MIDPLIPCKAIERYKAERALLREMGDALQIVGEDITKARTALVPFGQRLKQMAAQDPPASSVMFPALFTDLYIAAKYERRPGCWPMIGAFENVTEFLRTGKGWDSL